MFCRRIKWFVIFIFAFSVLLIPSTFSKYTTTFSKSLTISIKSPTYTVRFNPNGGTGSMDDMTLKYGDTKALNENTFEKENYVFKGWNTNKDGTGTWYYDEDEVNNLSGKDGDVITLYAQWQTYKIYFQLPPDWYGTNVYVYLYDQEGAVVNAKWPGSLATLIDNERHIYEYTVGEDEVDKYTHVIFAATLLDDGGSSRQTADLNFSKDVLGKIYVPELYDYSSGIRIFSEKYNNASPYLYLWGDNYGGNTNNGWPGIQMMDKFSDHAYKAIIDNSKYNKFIINCGSSSCQSNDLDVPIYQDMTVILNGSHSETIRRLYYFGSGHDYDQWINIEYAKWKADDYVNFKQAQEYYNYN